MDIGILSSLFFCFFILKLSKNCVILSDTNEVSQSISSMSDPSPVTSTGNPSQIISNDNGVSLDLKSNSDSDVSRSCALPDMKITRIIVDGNVLTVPSSESVEAVYCKQNFDGIFTVILAGGKSREFKYTDGKFLCIKVELERDLSKSGVNGALDDIPISKQGVDLFIDKNCDKRIVRIKLDSISCYRPKSSEFIITSINIGSLSYKIDTKADVNMVCHVLDNNKDYFSIAYKYNGKVTMFNLVSDGKRIIRDFASSKLFKHINMDHALTHDTFFLEDEVLTNEGSTVILKLIDISTHEYSLEIMSENLKRTIKLDNKLVIPSNTELNDIKVKEYNHKSELLCSFRAGPIIVCIAYSKNIDESIYVMNQLHDNPLDHETFIEHFGLKSCKDIGILHSDTIIMDTINTGLRVQQYGRFITIDTINQSKHVIVIQHNVGILFKAYNTYTLTICNDSHYVNIGIISKIDNDITHYHLAGEDNGNFTLKSLKVIS